MSSADRWDARMEALDVPAKPVARAIPHRDLGDGPECPEDPMHGRTYIVPVGDGRELCWCPVSQARFALVGGHDAGERIRASGAKGHVLCPGLDSVAHSGA